MTARNDKQVSKAAQKAIFHEAASACAFCDDRTLEALEIHHIHPRADGGSNDRSNLILTCANCHNQIESGAITLSTILKTKDSMRRGAAPARKRRPDAAPVPNNVINFRGPNAGIVANQVKLTTPRRVRTVPPAGVIDTDADKRTYIAYLLKRYNEFKRAEVKGGMKYGIINKTIQREFGCTWNMVPLVRFDDLVEYIHDRIDNTRLGRNKRAQGERRYSTYPEYLSNHRY